MRSPLRRLCPALFIFSLLLTLAGCATTAANQNTQLPARHTVTEIDDEQIAYSDDDPWERFNRTMYRFNYTFDKYLFIPLVSSYEFVTPTLAQTGISNFFGNIGEIRNLYNTLLQAKVIPALTTVGRFAVNSTIGVGGLFDPATGMGLIKQREDFGLTLGEWGLNSGPYLVLPILGPSSLRDAGGYAVDSGIYYGIYCAVNPFGHVNNGIAYDAGITTLTAIDLRHKEKFRYYESGYPFEYYMVRVLYREKRELEKIK
jgi:phospholipid-binding lipoprotein MlaA